jgi:hypothetical protein
MKASSGTDRADRGGITATGGFGYRPSTSSNELNHLNTNGVIANGLKSPTEEAPGEVELFQGRSYKSYVAWVGGMQQGSRSAIPTNGANSIEPYNFIISTCCPRFAKNCRVTSGYLVATRKRVFKLTRKYQFAAASGSYRPFPVGYSSTSFPVTPISAPPCST